MRIRPIALCVLAVFLTSGNSAQAAWFCRKCSQSHTSSSSSTSRNVEAARNVAAAPPAKTETAAPLAISSSGLESEIQKRLSDWAAKGITPGAAADATTAETVTVQVGGQTIEITVRVKGTATGGVQPPPSGDLVKDLQAAFSADTVLPGTDKVKIKDNLSKAFADLAAKFKSNDDIQLGTLVVADKEDVGFLVRATLRRFAGAGNLPKTQGAILGRLERLMPRNDRTVLTPQIRGEFAVAFGEIAAALSALK